MTSSQAQAGFLVGNNPGGVGGSDTLAKVMEEIDEWNVANGPPNLIYPTGLFVKTDDDESFVFDPNNGFMFFEDPNGATPITDPNDLTMLSEAYFKYVAPDPNAPSILYYSVKGPSNFGFSLYTFMSGLNLLDLSGDSSEISHVSFWAGPRGIDPFGTPEPSTLILGSMSVAWWMGRRRRS